MSSHKYRIGQLVRVTDPMLQLNDVPGVIIDLGTFGYYVAAATGNPLAKASYSPVGNGGQGWFLLENEITPFEAAKATKPKPLPASRAALTPSAHAIAKHLAREGNISGVEASALYKTRQLPGRISELRHYGYDIASNFDADCLGQRYVRYHLVREPSKVAA